MSTLKFKDPSTGNWTTIAPTAGGVPSGGTTGQVLKKTSGGYGWSTLTASDVGATASDIFAYSLSINTAIPENADLNNTTYLVCGNYAARTDSIAITILHAPSGLNEAFMLKVYAPIDPGDGTTVTGTWKYRIQEIHSMYGNKIWRRFCHIDGTADTWVFENWHLITVQDGIYVVSSAPTSSSADGIYFVTSS